MRTGYHIQHDTTFLAQPVDFKLWWCYENKTVGKFYTHIWVNPVWCFFTTVLLSYHVIVSVVSLFFFVMRHLFATVTTMEPYQIPSLNVVLKISKITFRVFLRHRTWERSSGGPFRGVCNEFYVKWVTSGLEAVKSEQTLLSIHKACLIVEVLFVALHFKLLFFPMCVSGHGLCEVYY